MDRRRVTLQRGVGLEPQGTIPHVLFMAYQATVCIITAALISGSIVERMRFSMDVAFMSIRQSALTSFTYRLDR